MQEISLKGKNALVTGGSQGIGSEICRELARCGANVAVNYYSNKEKAELLAKELEQTYSIEAFAVGADIADAENVNRMFQKIDSHWDSFDILVNNAGVETVDHALDLEESKWDRVMGTNLKGPWLCSQQAGKRMRRHRSGVIINISSIHDSVPRKGLIHYCSAKAGLRMFSKCLSLELAEDNIRVLSIAPGAIETEMNKEEIARFGKDKFERWIPQKRLGSVQDIAPSVAFFASDLASYITGTDIYIDGAYMNHTIQYDPRPKKS
ncbi:MAG: SDR family NAD(P)-dependent oxidoreductase [Prolixibacteraceae bacterium]|jgi:NAD(P)-dependent dehydrogenase (short-subunit alcohol dehydrogenase family)|nr:glucose 1-dehydrogenase [Prolixibacteraceae bacterium]